MKYNIYYLTTEKDDFSPVYVGITVNTLLTRLSGHKNDAKKGNAKVHNWIKGRISDGYSIEIILLDVIDTDEIYFWEDFYIDLLKSWGFSLKNMLYSGYSEKNINNKGRMSEDAKHKLSLMHTGVKLSRDRVELSIKNRLIEAKRKGYYHSEETLLKLSKAKIGRKVSEAERLRLIEIRKLAVMPTTPIMAINIKTNVVVYSESVSEFCRNYGTFTGNIAKVMNGTRNHTKNWWFCKYLETCELIIK